MKEYYRLAAIMFPLVMVSGCVSGPSPLPNVVAAGSVIEYAEKLVEATQPTAMTSIQRRNGAGQFKRNEFADHVELLVWWCPDHPEVKKAVDVQNQFRIACRNLEGEYDVGFCRSSVDPDEVLFFFRVYERRRCAPRVPGSDIVVLEPKYDSKREAYVDRLRSFGFRTKADIEAWNEQTKNRREANAKARRNRSELTVNQYEARQKENLRLSVGDRICRTGVFEYHTSIAGRKTTTVGTLFAQFEKRSPDERRIQLRILRAELPEVAARRKAPPVSTPRLGDFNAVPGTLYWDDSGHWTEC